MKTKKSFSGIWTDWLEDKGSFHGDADIGEQLQSRESSSLSSSIGNEGPFRLREAHQKPQTPNAAMERVKVRAGEGRMEIIKLVCANLEAPISPEHYLWLWNTPL